MEDKSIPFKKSYRHLIDDKIFLDKEGNNDAEEKICRRYKTVFGDIQALLQRYGVSESCAVNPELLWKATLDYFEDIARLKAFHGHHYVQTDKIYAYEAYWYLRNHPIQIVKADEVPEAFVHINEYVFSFWLIKNMATELESRFAPNIQIDDFIEKLEDHDAMVEFRKKLYYTFKYRQYTQQSLLLLIEGFMAAAEFVLFIT